MEDDLEAEINDVRLEVATLRALIDSVLDQGAQPHDLLLQASSQVLRARRQRLEKLERRLDSACS
jgi:hypothetical protein